MLCVCAQAYAPTNAGVVDWNPSGANILAVYKFGSGGTGPEGLRHAVDLPVNSTGHRSGEIRSYPALLPQAGFVYC